MASKLPEPIASFRTTLTNKITDSATTIYIDSYTDDDGNTMNGKILQFVIDRGLSTEEYVQGTVDSATSSLTSVTRGLSVVDGATSVSGNKFAHRKKATIEITDHPALAMIVRRMNGTDAFDADNRPIMDVDQDATDDKQLITQGQLNRTAMGGVTSSRVLVAGTAGATVAAGNLIYFDDTDNEWKLCDADTASTVDNVLLGIAQGAGTDGNAITGGVLLMGVDTNQSGMTAGDTMYAGNTAGGISSSAGTTEVTVGIAKSTTELYFAPRYNQQLTEAQQDLIAGITASASEINQLDGATISAAQLTEAGTFFGATDITGAEAETLTDGAQVADTKHLHNFSRLIGAQGAQASHTGSTAKTTLATFTVPAGAMGANGKVKIAFKGGSSGTAGTKNWEIKFGGTQVGTWSQAAADGGEYLAGAIEIMNRNSESSQTTYYTLALELTDGVLASFGNGNPAPTIDTTSAVTILITGELANSADTITLEAASAEVLYSA